MKIKSEHLLDDLINKTLTIIEHAESFQKLSAIELNSQPGENKWSILECIGHLNLYSDFYINEFKNRISMSKYIVSEYHKIGFLGNRFSKSMLPVGSVTPMKMKTFKSKYPLKSELSIATIEKFINQQNQIIELINQAREVNLTKTKCNLTINITSLRLGDALRFYVFHNVRHIVQANRIIGKTNDF